jgi:hypothetical protein
MAAEAADVAEAATDVPGACALVAEAGAAELGCDGTGERAPGCAQASKTESDTVRAQAHSKLTVATARLLIDADERTPARTRLPTTCTSSQ